MDSIPDVCLHCPYYDEPHGCYYIYGEDDFICPLDEEVQNAY